MTLQEFINAKPVELRLGQWYFNCFLQHLTYEERCEREMSWLYNTRDSNAVVNYLVECMTEQQWEALEAYGT